MSDAGSRLLVERTHVLPGRPWVFVSGRLTGDPLEIGSTLTLRYGDRAPVAAVVRTIEIHSPPGITTIAIDGALRDSVGPGAVLTS